MKARKKIGLALGSGAYRGFAHIGVIKSLEKNNIPIDYLSGASVGAWVAAYYARFKETKTLQSDLINNQKENMSLLFDFAWNKGLIKGEKFLFYLNKKLQNCSFSELKIPLGIVSTDLKTGKSYVFKQGRVASAIRASCAVPLVFKVVEYKGKLLVDGGLSNPVPVSVIKEMGADIVIGVNLYNQQEFINKKYSESNIVVRSTMIMLSNLAKETIKLSDIIIEPDLSSFTHKSGFMKYFNKRTALEMVDIGEKSTDKLIPKIKKILSS